VGVFLLAVDGGRVVGVAMMFCRTLARLKGIGEFVIYVRQDYQGQGLGSCPTRTFLGEARSRGLHRVGLGVVADNRAAIKVYEQAGFAFEGRLRDACFGDDGRYHYQVIMGIIL
jgi:RimJ/RimL family protein N-acetyltransferase